MSKLKIKAVLKLNKYQIITLFCINKNKNIKRKGAVFLTGKEILAKAALVLDSRKAEDVRAIYIEGVSILADYFLLASGTSTTQVKALAEELEAKLAEAGAQILRSEGASSATWIILDYGSVVIHVFHQETRKFYNLERLWADGKLIEMEELLGEQAKIIDAQTAGSNIIV